MQSGSQRQLDAAQQITHIGSWEWDLATGVVTWSDELYRIYGLAPRSCEITLEEFLARVHPDDRERVQRQVAAAVERGGPFGHDERIVRPDGSVRKLDTVGEVLVDAHGRPVSLIGTCRDITDDPREFARLVQAGEQRALEMLATGAPLPDVLAELVRLVEEMAPEALASILLMDDTGTRIQHGAAPSLPDAYNRAIHGAIIGPQAGSCGTAAFRRKPVFVTDIETDPLWEPYRDLARSYGLRACWSFPILATDGQVLGTVAVYYRQPRTADPTVVELVSRVAHVAAIAIERRQIDERALALSERTEAIREDERTSIARELHDQLGQSLTALKLDISWLARRLAGDPAMIRKLEEMKQTADGIIQSVGRISAGLRPGILDLLGLEAAIKWQSQEFTKQTGIACELRARLDDRAAGQQPGDRRVPHLSGGVDQRHPPRQRLAGHRGPRTRGLRGRARSGRRWGRPAPGRAPGPLARAAWHGRARPPARRRVRGPPAGADRHAGLAAGSAALGPVKSPTGRKGVTIRRHH